MTQVRKTDNIANFEQVAKRGEVDKTTLYIYNKNGDWVPLGNEGVLDVSGSAQDAWIITENGEAIQMLQNMKMVPVTDSCPAGYRESTAEDCENIAGGLWGGKVHNASMPLGCVRDKKRNSISYNTYVGRNTDAHEKVCAPLDYKLLPAVRHAPINCAASHGTTVDVDKSSRRDVGSAHVCPADKPECVHYKHGRYWGACNLACPEGYRMRANIRECRMVAQARGQPFSFGSWPQDMKGCHVEKNARVYYNDVSSSNGNMIEPNQQKSVCVREDTTPMFLCLPGISTPVTTIGSDIACASNATGRTAFGEAAPFRNFPSGTETPRVRCCVMTEVTGIRIIGVPK